MEKFVKGDVVVLPFPFSNLSSSKRRPALIVANLDGDDVVVCEITSQARNDGYIIELANKDFKQGSLPIDSCIIRPNKLFTADKIIILKKVGSLKEAKIKELEDKLIKMIKS
jgi:mRNA interferase MazF